MSFQLSLELVQQRLPQCLWPQEIAYYTQLWRAAHEPDPGNPGAPAIANPVDTTPNLRLSGRPAFDFLSRASMLTKPQLKQIWTLADWQATGGLGFAEFAIACRLIFQVQAGGIMQIQHVFSQNPQALQLPNFEGIPNPLMMGTRGGIGTMAAQDIVGRSGTSGGIMTQVAEGMTNPTMSGIASGQQVFASPTAGMVMASPDQPPVTPQNQQRVQVGGSASSSAPGAPTPSPGLDINLDLFPTSSTPTPGVVPGTATAIPTGPRNFGGTPSHNVDDFSQQAGAANDDWGDFDDGGGGAFASNAPPAAPHEQVSAASHAATTGGIGIGTVEGVSPVDNAADDEWGDFGAVTATGVAEVKTGGAVWDAFDDLVEKDVAPAAGAGVGVAPAVVHPGGATGPLGGPPAAVEVGTVGVSDAGQGSFWADADTAAGTPTPAAAPGGVVGGGGMAAPIDNFDMSSSGAGSAFAALPVAGTLNDGGAAAAAGSFDFGTAAGAGPTSGSFDATHVDHTAQAHAADLASFSSFQAGGASAEDDFAFQSAGPPAPLVPPTTVLATTGAAPTDTFAAFDAATSATHDDPMRALDELASPAPPSSHMNAASATPASVAETGAQPTTQPQISTQAQDDDDWGDFGAPSLTPAPDNGGVFAEPVAAPNGGGDEDVWGSFGASEAAHASSSSITGGNVFDLSSPSPGPPAARDWDAAFAAASAPGGLPKGSPAPSSPASFHINGGVDDDLLAGAVFVENGAGLQVQGPQTAAGGAPGDGEADALGSSRPADHEDALAHAPPHASSAAAPSSAMDDFQSAAAPLPKEERAVGSRFASVVLNLVAGDAIDRVLFLCDEIQDSWLPEQVIRTYEDRMNRLHQGTGLGGSGGSSRWGGMGHPASSSTSAAVDDVDPFAGLSATADHGGDGGPDTDNEHPAPPSSCSSSSSSSSKYLESVANVRGKLPSSYLQPFDSHFAPETQGSGALAQLHRHVGELLASTADSASIPRETLAAIRSAVQSRLLVLRKANLWKACAHKFPDAPPNSPARHVEGEKLEFQALNALSEQVVEQCGGSEASGATSPGEGGTSPKVGDDVTLERILEHFDKNSEPPDSARSVQLCSFLYRTLVLHRLLWRLSFFAHATHELAVRATQLQAFFSRNKNLIERVFCREPPSTATSSCSGEKLKLLLSQATNPDGFLNEAHEEQSVSAGQGRSNNLCHTCGLGGCDFSSGDAKHAAVLHQNQMHLAQCLNAVRLVVPTQK